MTRKIHTKEVTVDVEYVFYRSEGAVKAPRLARRPLIMDPIHCQMNQDLVQALLYGTSSPGYSSEGITGIDTRYSRLLPEIMPWEVPYPPMHTKRY